MSTPLRFSKWSPLTAYGLGIDIGQYSTKIVHIERCRGQDLQVSAATIPTQLLGNQNIQAVEETSAETNRPPRPDKGRTEVAAVQAADYHAPIRQWSKIPIKRLAQHMEQALAGKVRMHRPEVHVALSMSACDFRNIYTAPETQVNATAIQQAITQATGDSRSRCVALLPAIDKPESGKSSKIRCLSIPEELSWSVAMEFDAIGITPRAINGLPWCMANALELCVTPGNAIVVGFDWSFGNPTLVAVRDGTIDYVRCVSHGSIREMISQAVDELRMSVPEAVRWLSHCMTNSVEAQAMESIAAETREWIVDCGGRLASEINTALDFIRWRHQGSVVDGIWLMGGGSQIPGLVQLLEGQVSVEVRSWSLQTAAGALTADYATAGSLAMAGVQHA